MRKASQQKQRRELPSEEATGPASSLRRRWWFRLFAAVGIPCLLLFSLEGALRVAGWGYATGFFLKNKIGDHHVWTDNQEFGRRFFPPGLVRYPRPFVIPTAKPSNALRIFVLGESAAMGDPDPKFGMPRMLEVLLRERFPNQRFEVVNAAMVAINSHVILPIAQQCAQNDADLWIIYMGNNEIIGPFGSASVFGSQAPSLRMVRIGIWLKSTRLGQFVDSVLYWASSGKKKLHSWAGMEMMANQRIRHNAPSTQRVYRHFEQNLADILSSGARAGVPMLLCTVASNLKDCGPFASLHRADLGPQDLAKWQRTYDLGVASQDKGDIAQAKAAYDEAALIDDEYAELDFRRAECSLSLGKMIEAGDLFRQARDKDALQFRADGRINDSIRRSAVSFAGGRVTLLDSELLLADNSAQKLPGEEFFYEHVHFTPEGNYLLARALAEKAAQILSLESSADWVSQSECLRLLGFTDWNRYEALEIMHERIQGAPFTNQVNHSSHFRRIDDQLAHYRVSAKPAQVKRDLQQVARLVAAHPEDPDLRWNMAVLLETAGDTVAAETEWRALLKMQPQAALPRFNLAKLLDRLGKYREAYPLYRAGLRINPEYYPARYALGGLCLKMGLVPEAISHLRLTVGQKPEATEPRLLLSKALVQAGRPGEAEGQLREILQLDPKNVSAQEQLRTLSSASGSR